MRGMRISAWPVFILPLLFTTVFFASSCAIPEARFESNLLSMRKALVRGEIKEALAFYESQAREAETNAAASRFPQKYWENAVAAYREAARAALASGQLQRSIAYGEKALDITRKAKIPVYNPVNPSITDYPPIPELHVVSILIAAYTSLRDFDRARVLIDRGFALVKEVPPNTDKRQMHESSLWAALGRDLVRRREYEKAIDAYFQAVHLRQSLTAAYSTMGSHWLVEHSETNLAGLLTGLADAYRLAGRVDDAVQQYQQALNYIKKGGLRRTYEHRIYRGLGEVYLRQKHFAAALENFHKALALAERRQNPAAISSASRRIGDIFREAGNPAQAVPHYQRAVEHIESTRSLLQSEEYRQSYFEGALHGYVNIARALSEVGEHEQAFNYNERARSRVLLDILGSKVQLSRVKSGLLEEERALQERIASIKARLAGGDSEAEARPEREGLRKELRDAEQAYNAFLSRVRKEDKEQASLMTVAPLTLKEVQELLDPGTSLVEYFVTGDEVFVWLVEKGRMHFERVALGRKELARLVTSLRETIFALGEKEKFREVSRQLYRHLLQPVVAHVTGKDLIIVPHDVLHYLPFHALRSSDGRYLIEQYPIYYLSSASLLQFTTAKRKAKGDRVLAFGNPDLGDPNKDLQFAELEAREVQKLYPRSTVLVRKEATEEKSKALSPQYDILHFAAHAELREEDPLSAAILLAKDGKEDGRLEVREIFGMDLRANLVVLSACETGLGKLSSGDELVGLTRAFIYAGAPSVVASLWKVEDDTTAALMASFYKNLRTMSKVEALRQAQLELIRGKGRSDLLARRGVGGIGKLDETPQPEGLSEVSVPGSSSVSTSHPYFWAPFILVGDGK